MSQQPFLDTHRIDDVDKETLTKALADRSLDMKKMRAYVFMVVYDELELDGSFSLVELEAFVEAMRLMLARRQVNQGESNG